jgi:hypothetical protein
LETVTGMPLTSKERSALWRKRQKEDPTKHELYKQRERERYQKRKKTGEIKTINEMSDRDQRKQRRHWKENQRSKREKDKRIKKAMGETITPPTSPEHFFPEQPNRIHERNRLSGRKKKNRNRSKAYRDQFKLRIMLNKERRLKNKYKKRYFRLIKSNKDEIEQKVEHVMKQKQTTKRALSLYFLLVRIMKQRYSGTHTQEKRILKKLIFRETVLKKYKIGS